MPLRIGKFCLAAGLLAAVWSLDWTRGIGEKSWLQPVSGGGPVRIVRFYASVPALTRGEKALLCYGVENARSVRISPMLQRSYPAGNRCMEIVPEHTTHYTLLAEGYDGKIATRSFTLPVETRPAPAQTPQFLYLAALDYPRNR
jgi:hypothetical protein